MLYDSGIMKPQSILYELRRQSLNEPALRQLNNYLSTYRRKKHGKTQISYYDLEIWCSKRTMIQMISTINSR